MNNNNKLKSVHDSDSLLLRLESVLGTLDSSAVSTFFKDMPEKERRQCYPFIVEWLANNVPYKEKNYSTDNIRSYLRFIAESKKLPEKQILEILNNFNRSEGEAFQLYRGFIEFLETAILSTGDLAEIKKWGRGHRYRTDDNRYDYLPKVFLYESIRKSLFNRKPKWMDSFFSWLLTRERFDVFDDIRMF